jgi:class 3 adenylate cyclase
MRSARRCVTAAGGAAARRKRVGRRAQRAGRTCRVCARYKSRRPQSAQKESQRGAEPPRARARRAARRGEDTLFEVQFRDSATQVIAALTNGLEDKGSAAAAAASFLGALGSRCGAFPNVTFPGFTAFAEAQLALAQARALSFNPLLPAAALPGWTAYARASLALLGAPPATLATITATAAATGVYERNAANAVVPSSPARPFTAPVWQIAPWATNAAAVFYDLHSQADRQRALDAVLASGRPAVTSIITLVQDRVANISRASGIVFAPVFDASSAAVNASTTVVGFTSVVFSWDSFLASSLPAFITGIDVVLSSAANNVTFTFRVVRGTVAATYPGDTHERGMDALMQTTDLDAADLGQRFELRLYPTAALRDSYYTRNPQDACVGVVCIIVCLALVFWLYDMAVTYHSGELAAVASIASRIVAGVFPETVRNRIWRTAATNASAAAQGGGGLASRSGGGGRYSGGADSTVSSGSAGGGAVSTRSSGAVTAAVKFMRKLAAGRDISSSSPRHSSGTTAASGVDRDAAIADHFDDCTVLFADLVSFTRWSADVTPERVFSVLEAVFGEFDAAARKLGVFKVETIGDCYMAATGLPSPNEAHATVMADFALQLEPLLARACEFQGVAPGQLSLRVGLHSGSVTAGVLRADRSRFQLFGDTVNTASRMESTGEAQRIQVSASTEALLRVGGRHVLSYRGKTEAKGKGLVDTYWLTGVQEPPPLASAGDGSVRRGAAVGAAASASASAPGVAAEVPDAGPLRGALPARAGSSGLMGV